MDQPYRLAPLLLVAVLSAAFPATPAIARPACDLLRMCAADLADEMAAGPGPGCGQIWSAESIAQYRQMSTTDFEDGEDTVNICDPMFQVISNTARTCFELHELCRVPNSCRPDAYENLPAVPGR